MQAYNILVVDDEKNILKIVSATLKKEGYEVETAQSSEEAIEKFGQGAYHLVITDLKLPGKTGIELLEYIKSRDADVPVVVVTAFGSIENAVNAMKKGAFNYLAKPINSDELLSVAKEAIEKYELKRENTCNAPSVAFFMQAPFPMEIYQATELIVFKMEYFDLVRVIFLDGRPHPPASAPHTRSGHSVGHWEGDTLVVDTTHISSGTFMNNGFNHSDALHLVERFRLSKDGETLWLTQLYEDPQVFAGLAARYMAWTHRPGEYVYPYDCDPSYGQ